ncbi:MAG TPA: acetyl-CoA carboxylase, carboxyltransferase subunit beta [Candidatus Krumholzibacteria bacterium]|nr:acetyl-CoA carboxylase, carboxyltransferase subunit beta [Candidatus Krumholzibacteria bacterium]HPD72168.1 acetyl-CoA carboxylase, carboxyltransferase subunit beta [Candidatus Krumholzibacteria bacterium]HRY40900.1 acetyl-CoA carboxylase, carboxyltransferase subunit beta [Candidatus Krumholzibacteria bacterium]
MSWLNRAARGIQSLAKQKDVPDNLWQKCPGCGEILYRRELERSWYVCGACGFHLPLDAVRYIDLLLDADSWEELYAGVTSVDPLGFRDSRRYPDRLRVARRQTGREDAVITGRGRLDGLPVNLAVLDFAFMGGSLGSAMGEKIARLLLDASSQRRSAIVVSRSGGARMQESLFSLMQMAKTAAVLARLREEGVPFISLCVNPTYGGVTASFAMLGDLNLGEPGAMIGFAGPRVIKQTIGGDLPEGFQSAEFLLEKGQLDQVVERRRLKATLATILRWFCEDRDVSIPGPVRE